MAAAGTINTRKMRYTGGAMAAFKSSASDSPRSQLEPESNTSASNGVDRTDHFSSRSWKKSLHEPHAPRITDQLRHNIGNYPLTSQLAPWVYNASSTYQPGEQVQELVKPFSAQLHAFIENERKASSGLHDLDLIELAYQITLEVGAEILLAADANANSVDLQPEFHSSKAARDDHFAPWGRLLTGLECDPPIIAQFPFYLMMCQSFTFESTPAREDYVYSALTGVDWAKGKNIFSQKFAAFEKLAWASVPNLDDAVSGQDRSFWRIALAYLRAMNECENARKFTTPKTAAIEHDINHDLVIAVRAFDTIGSAFMCSDGAAWLDEAGMDSLIGSALPNDVMDLHTDILTGETRNLLRLLYPAGFTIDQSMQTVSTIFSGMLCELFRGHQRARFGNREDGRIAATSPPYSFCRARHRRIFETLEAYTSRYPQFWEWTWDIYRRAKAQVTAAGLNEPLVASLKRAGTQSALPPSAPSTFYEIYYAMIEDGASQMQAKKPLGVSDDLAAVTRSLYALWHDELRVEPKPAGWGADFDARSDALLAEAGRIFNARGGVSDDVYKFAIAYGRLSMALPYVAYHTVDAIIMTFGALA